MCMIIHEEHTPFLFHVDVVGRKLGGEGIVSIHILYRYSYVHSVHLSGKMVSFRNCLRRK